jgi:hypothetical protein
VSRYAVLSGRIKRQLQDLELEYIYTLEQAELARSTQVDAYWIASGFGLQGFYTGIEKIFEQIAQSVDESLSKQSERWHQELLEQMRIEVPGTRPAVIDETTYRWLRVYLGFRHVVRNNYTHRLDARLIEQNVNSLAESYQRFQHDIAIFCQFLEAIAADT